MNSSKKILNKVAESYQKQEVPSDIQNELQERLLLEKNKQIKKRHKKQTIVSISALLPLLLVSLIAFNGQVRAFAADLPLLGPIVQLITGEEYQEKTAENSVDVKVPKINEENQVAVSLNKKYLAEGKENYQKAVDEFGSFENGHYQVTADYQKVVDDVRFLVVKRETTRIAADSHTENQYDTIDKKANVLLSLPMLFKDDRYLDVISKEIQQQMDQQRQESENAMYWTQEDIKEGTIPELKLMKPDRGFYINQKHQLVITFPEYEIAPGYMGTPEFVIPTEKIKKLLVDKHYLD